MRNFLSYAWQFAVAPGKAAERMAVDPLNARHGFSLAMVFLGAYSITVLIYFLLGHQPVSEGWLTVPRDRWYLLQTFTTIPVGLAAFFSYSAICHFLCRAAGGTGSFEATFASQMFALILPCVVFMLLLELFVAPILIARGTTRVPWPDWVEILRVFVLPFAWIFFMATVSLSRVQRVPWPAALGFVVIALIPTGMIMAVFIR
jgi:hypothetical protein